MIVASISVYEFFLKIRKVNLISSKKAFLDFLWACDSTPKGLIWLDRYTDKDKLTLVGYYREKSSKKSNRTVDKVG